VVASLLLLLLPLQATAVMTICPQSRLAVTAAMQEPDHCLRMSALPVGDAQPGAILADEARSGVPAPEQGCSDVYACAMCTVVPSWLRLPGMSVELWRPVLPLSSPFTSVVLEGPLRPPSRLA